LWTGSRGTHAAATALHDRTRTELNWQATQQRSFLGQDISLIKCVSKRAVGPNGGVRDSPTPLLALSWCPAGRFAVVMGADVRGQGCQLGKFLGLHTALPTQGSNPALNGSDPL
jgi:hypothetical protein